MGREEEKRQEAVPFLETPRERGGQLEGIAQKSIGVRTLSMAAVCTERAD
jgi:hypothetical protein